MTYYTLNISDPELVDLIVQQIDQRLMRYYNGNPNGNLDSPIPGPYCFNTAASTLYICGATGTSGGVSDWLLYLPGASTPLTIANETATLPNSRRLNAGNNVTFDLSVPGLFTINASGGGGGGGGSTTVSGPSNLLSWSNGGGNATATLVPQASGTVFCNPSTGTATPNFYPLLAGSNTTIALSSSGIIINSIAGGQSSNPNAYVDPLRTEYILAPEQANVNWTCNVSRLSQAGAGSGGYEGIFGGYKMGGFVANPYAIQCFSSGTDASDPTAMDLQPIAFGICMLHSLSTDRTWFAISPFTGDVFQSGTPGAWNGTPHNTVGFRFDPSISANWQVYCGDGSGGSTAVDTGIPPSTSIPQRFKIESIGNVPATSVNFSINATGTYSNPITVNANLPTHNQMLNCGWMTYSSSGSFTDVVRYGQIYLQSY